MIFLFLIDIDKVHIYIILWVWVLQELIIGRWLPSHSWIDLLKVYLVVYRQILDAVIVDICWFVVRAAVVVHLVIQVAWYLSLDTWRHL